MYNVILVYEMIPDTTQIYVLSLDLEDYTKICKCHNVYDGFEIPDSVEDKDEAYELTRNWLPKKLEEWKKFMQFDTENLERQTPIEVTGINDIVHSGCSV